MAEPVNTEEKRDANGRFAPGTAPGKSPGRPMLPAWFKSRGPSALRILVAQATGEAMPDDDGVVSAAVVQVAADSSTKERGAASIEMANRIYGKAPETMTLEGELAISRIVRTIVDPKSDG